MSVERDGGGDGGGDGVGRGGNEARGSRSISIHGYSSAYGGYFLWFFGEYHILFFFLYLLSF